MGISRFIVKPLSKAINQSITGSEEFDPLTLFVNGEEGAWYDPSDLTTLYQDSAGTIPVTTDSDPVGLMLDKHSPIGEELADPNAVYVKDDDSSEIVIASGLSLTAGNRYIVSFRKFDHTAGDPRIEFAGTQYLGLIPDVGVDRTVTLALVAGVGSTLKLVGIAARISITEVSIKEVSGNHATQPTSSLKPIYRTDGTLHWLESDGFDDYIQSSAGSINAQPTTQVCAFQGIALPSGSNIYNGVTASSVQYLINSSGSFRFSAGTESLIGSSDLNPHVINLLYNGASSLARYDGVAGATVDAGINGWEGNTFFANRVFGGNSNIKLFGHITVCREMADKERVDSERYLATKSGATL